MLRVKDVAEHLDVSLGTVQHDVPFSMPCDYIILDGDEPGTYTFSKRHKAYEARGSTPSKHSR